MIGPNIPSRFPCCVLSALSSNTANENLSWVGQSTKIFLASAAFRRKEKWEKDNKNDNDNQNDENIAYNDDNNELPLPRCLLTRLECSCQTTLMETPSLFSLFLIVFQKPIEWVVSFWYCHYDVATRRIFSNTGYYYQWHCCPYDEITSK